MERSYLAEDFKLNSQSRLGDSKTEMAVVVDVVEAMVVVVVVGVTDQIEIEADAVVVAAVAVAAAAEVEAMVVHTTQNTELLLKIYQLEQVGRILKITSDKLVK